MGKVQEAISKYETETISNGVFQQTEGQNKVQATLEQLLYSCDMNSSIYSDNTPTSTTEVHNNVPTNSTTVLTPQGYMNIRPVQASYPLTPLGSGGFIFNYPPLYSFTPISPFSQSVVVNGEAVATSSSPLSPPTSPSYPTSPAFQGIDQNSSKRQEKLEKYRQKRGKRNWNRPVDQARRERAQHRVRDEFGHFVSSKQQSSKYLQDEMMDVKLQLQEFRMESLQLKNKLNEVEIQLEEQQKLNSALSAFLHENRILYPTVPTADLFNTLNPNASYADAFKEKIDFSAIDLHWTESPYNQKDPNTSSFSLDPPSFS
jgi:hypothetical protein